MKNNNIRIAVDVMGGDFAPHEIILGIISALKEIEDLEIFAFGNEDTIEEILYKENFESDRLKIVNADEIITMSDSPVLAVRKKRESSLVKAVLALKDNEVEGVLSAGNSGAVLVAAQAYIKRLQGIKRTPLAPVIPTEKGSSILVDCGANVDARPEHLVDFAILGSVYAREICGIENPKVALINIGTEDEKGNKLVKETAEILKNLDNVNYIGYIEAREILSGEADVLVCDAFVGNVVIKLLEGVISTAKSTLKKAIFKNIRTRIGALLLKESFKEALKPYDISKIGGAPLLGLDGIVVKCHGNSKNKDVHNGIVQTYDYIKKDINNIIKEELSKNGVK